MYPQGACRIRKAPSSPTAAQSFKLFKPQNWRKRSAEARRRNCAVLPKEKRVEGAEMERIEKENYYLDIAQTVLERSTCLRRRYGAIIVRNDEIVATGYNGAPPGRNARSRPRAAGPAEGGEEARLPRHRDHPDHGRPDA